MCRMCSRPCDVAVPSEACAWATPRMVYVERGADSGTCTSNTAFGALVEGPTDEKMYSAWVHLDKYLIGLPDRARQVLVVDTTKRLRAAGAVKYLKWCRL